MPRTSSGHSILQSAAGCSLLAALIATGCVAQGDGAALLEGEQAQAVGGGTGPIDPPPSGLFTRMNSDTSIELGWRCGSNQAAAHHVMRSEGPNGAETEVSSLAACPVGQTRYATSGIQPATEYCFRVVADNDEHTATSEQVCATTPLDLTIPLQPEVHVTEVGPWDLHWSLSDRATNESYIALEYREQGTTAWFGRTFQRGVRAHRGTGPVATLHAESLKSGTVYEYRTRIGHDFVTVEAVSPLFTVKTLDTSVIIQP